MRKNGDDLRIRRKQLPIHIALSENSSIMCGNLDFEYLPTATATETATAGAFVAAPCALHLQWPLGLAWW